MAPAIVVTSSGSNWNIIDPVPLSEPAAVSIVLLYPEHIGCKVVREFAPVKGTGTNDWTERCRRYAVRRYPKMKNVKEATRSVLSVGQGQAWTATAIVQEVWDSPVTGIIRRTSDGYIIDVAQGHFVPKGVVEVSTITLSNDKALIAENWRNQTILYHFVDGHVVTESPLKQQMRLSVDQIANIAATLDPLFDIYVDAALEFGLIEKDGVLSVYLIDVAEGDSNSVSLDHNLISSGVLSAGTCKGRVERLQNHSAGSLDLHLHDQRQTMHKKENPTVIVADFPSTELLPQLCNPNVIGFVFRRASVLAHLPVVLREKGLPAIALEEDTFFDALNTGDMVELDAVSSFKTASERIKVLGSTQ